jgi:hypothetical protein
MKQTAVEWLFSQLPDHFQLSRDGFDTLQQAKEMEKTEKIFFANFCRVFDVKNPNEIISVVDLLDKYNQEGDYKK